MQLVTPTLMRINNSLLTKSPVWEGVSGRNRLNSHSYPRICRAAA
jgi:hypothetical protein